MDDRKYKIGDIVVIKESGIIGTVSTVGNPDLSIFTGAYFIRLLGGGTEWVGDEDIILDIEYYRDKQINNIINE